MTTESSDIISNLPYEIKEKILHCLPIKDAVRTSILSTKWRYVWASLRNLVFENRGFISDHFRDMFSEFVDQFLLLHDGLIRKFQLTTEFYSSPAIDRWILVVSRKKIQYFRLLLSEPEDDMYKVHSSLFSCHELRHLWLENCAVTLPRNFKGLGKLKTLKLREILISDDDLSYLVSSCPKLQLLELHSSENDHSLDIEGKEGQLLTISEFTSISISANSNPIDEGMNLTNGFANVPTNLLAGQFIEQMEVRGGDFFVPHDFQGLDKLETLTLNNLIFSPERLEHLILSCTQLKKFLFTVDVADRLKIHSNSLQCLKIDCFESLHLFAPLLHDASFNLLSFKQKWSDGKANCKLIEKNFDLLEVMADLYTTLDPASTFNHLVNLSLAVKFGDIVSEYALFCFVEKAKALQSLKIKASSEQQDSPNIWEFVMSRDLELVFDQLLTVRFDGFLGTEHELSFLMFILVASPALKTMTVAPVKGQRQRQRRAKSTPTYQTFLKLKELSSPAVITFV